jgi:hypothetical protein
MVKIYNNTRGKAPRAGDVIAFSSSTGSVGHAAVVTGSTIDSSGNGQVTIMQQNWSIISQTVYYLTVTNWHVNGPRSDPRLSVKGWLHYQPH